MRTSTERMFIEQLLDLCQLEHIPIGDIRRLEVVATSNGASIEIAFAVPGSHEEIQALAKQPPPPPPPNDGAWTLGGADKRRGAAQ